MTLETPEGPQLTIGGLITQLGAFPADREVLLAGFGNAGVPGTLRRHRSHRNDVVIEASYNPFDPCSVVQLVTMLRSHAGQQATASNPDPATLESPVWVAEHTEGTVSFKAAVRVDSFSGRPVIRWVDVAPVHGPALQRLPDVDVLRRNAELDGRTDANVDPDSDGNRWTLAYLPRERDRARNQLPAARADVARARTELDRALREVARLEARVDDIDYVLGLTDVRPAARA
jgi:hypothetical protein